MPVREAPLTTSIGLNACTCMSGTRRLTSAARSKYAVPGRSGWMPPCMQTSVAPDRPRLLGPLPTSSSDRLYASASVRRWAKAQKRQPV